MSRSLSKLANLFLLLIAITAWSATTPAPAQTPKPQETQSQGPEAAQATEAAITGVRFSQSEARLRVVFDCSAPPEVRNRLKPSKLDLRLKAKVQPEALEQLDALKSPLLKKLTFKVTSEALVLAFETADKVVPNIFALKQPDRVVVDFCKLFHTRTERKLDYGLTLVTLLQGTAEGPIRTWVLIIPRKSLSSLVLEPAVASETIWKRRTVVELAKRVSAYAAVNGGFFTWQGPAVGLVMVKGEPVAAAVQRRSGVVCDKEGNLHFGRFDLAGWVKIGDKKLKLMGLNTAQVPSKGAVVLNHWWGKQTPALKGVEAITVADGKLVDWGAGALALPQSGFAVLVSQAQARELPELKRGTPITFTWHLLPEVKDAVWALGGGPRLLDKGKIPCLQDDEGFGKGFVTHRHPRTALGMRPDGTLVLVVVDGRQPCWSIGLSLPDLARLMRDELGCTDAVNLDGGGSTTFYLDGKVVNQPSDGHLRPVSNGLCLYPKHKATKKPPVSPASGTSPDKPGD